MESIVSLQRYWGEPLPAESILYPSFVEELMGQLKRLFQIYFKSKDEYLQYRRKVVQVITKKLGVI